MFDDGIDEKTLIRLREIELERALTEEERAGVEVGPVTKMERAWWIGFDRGKWVGERAGHKDYMELESRFRELQHERSESAKRSRFGGSRMKTTADFLRRHRLGPEAVWKPDE